MSEPHDLDEINRIRELLLAAITKAVKDDELAREIEAGIDALIDAKFELYANAPENPF